MSKQQFAEIGVVIIGRNEGDRLLRCLASLAADLPAVYVDSASSDQSVAAARGHVMLVIELSTPPPLTAARGRNTGFEALTAAHPDLRYVQFVDGDCEVQPGWIAAGRAVLDADPGLALVFGRRRERFPDRSIYNVLCDDEWNTPLGEALACGGDILCRVDALQAIGGYAEDMIAGEDPDMSMRLRRAGWRLRRVDAEMTLHDAAILSFAQWWRRTVRGGHAFAELADRHPGLRSPDWRRQCRSVLLWALILPLTGLVAVAWALLVDPRVSGVVAAIILLYPAQMARIALRRNDLPPRQAAASGVFIVIGKFAELLGLLRYHRGRFGAPKADLIEYKGPALLR